jgi:hypothetical protein
MPVSLGESLSEKIIWQNVSKETEKKLKEHKLEEYSVEIREAYPNEEYFKLENNPSLMRAEFDSLCKKMMVIVPAGKIFKVVETEIQEEKNSEYDFDSIGGIDLENPQEFVEFNIIDTL